MIYYCINQIILVSTTVVNNGCGYLVLAVYTRFFPYEFAAYY